MSVVKTYNSQLTIFLKPTHSITISSVGLILLIVIHNYMYVKKKQITKRTVQPSVTHPPVHWDRSNWSPYIFFQLDHPPETELHIKDFGFSNCSTNKENFLIDIHLEGELEWGRIKEVGNGQTKYDCFHLSRIKVPLPNCTVSLEDYKSNIFLCQNVKPRQLE